MKRIVVLLALLFILGVPSVNANSWSEFSITIEEGETKIVSVEVTKPCSLELVPLYAFESYEGMVIYSPQHLDNGVNQVTIHLVELSEKERVSISPDLYRVKLNAVDNDGVVLCSLLIYIDIAGENILVEEYEYENRIVALENKLETTMNEIEALREEIHSENSDDLLISITDRLNTLIAEIGSFKAEIETDFSNFENVNIRRVSRLEEEVDNIMIIAEDALLTLNERIANVRKDLNNTNQMILTVGVVLILGVTMIFLKRKVFKGKPKPAQKESKEIDEFLEKVRKSRIDRVSEPSGPTQQKLRD